MKVSLTSSDILYLSFSLKCLKIREGSENKEEETQSFIDKFDSIYHNALDLDLKHIAPDSHEEYLRLHEEMIMSNEIALEKLRKIEQLKKERDEFWGILEEE